MASGNAVSPAREPLRLSPQTAEFLRDHAVRAWPEECCGALLADAAGSISARALQNVAGDRRRGFLVSARETLRLEADAEAEGLRLEGFYHSHPDGPATPSASDAATAWPQLWTVIVQVTAGVAAAPRAFRFEDTTRTFREVEVASFTLGSSAAP